MNRVKTGTLPRPTHIKDRFCFGSIEFGQVWIFKRRLEFGLGRNLILGVLDPPRLDYTNCLLICKYFLQQYSSTTSGRCSVQIVDHSSRPPFA